MTPRRDDDMTLPVDRKTPTSPPDPPINASQAIEIVERQLAPLRKQVNDIHETIMGVELPDGSVKGGIAKVLMGDKLPDGTIEGGIGKSFHDLNQNLTVIKGATQVIEDELIAVPPRGQRRKTMPDRIAEAVADRFIKIFQEEMRGIHEAQASLLGRVVALEEARAEEPNGHGPENT